MNESIPKSGARDWLEAELADTLDEDYELEMSEPALSLEIARIYKNAHPPSIDRMQYFRDLIGLQSELIKLQSWVAYHKKKLVVIFEGRDSAGKGGVIKRITQRLNPRICRFVALPAPTERDVAMVFPALCAAPAGRRRDRSVRPLLVQPFRRRAGDGFRWARSGGGILP